MAEYIEKSAAVALADYAADEHPYEKQAGKPETCSEYNQGWNDACDYIRDKLEKAPAADVAPVRHGRWERYHEADVGWDEWGVRCSNCGLEVEDKDFTFPEKFCPNCGAWMD